MSLLGNFKGSVLRILIVDDSEFILKIQEALVKKITPDVVTCQSGEEAVAMLKHDSSFDLVLMDMQMPNMLGPEAAQAIRNFNTSVKILALTGNNSLEDNQTCLRAGMNGILHKPLQLDALRSHLN